MQCFCIFRNSRIPRIAPRTGWSSDFPIEDIGEKVLDERIKTKRHRIEGYNLFREGKVISLASVQAGYLYFRGHCQPAMKDDKYLVYLLQRWWAKVDVGHVTMPSRKRRAMQACCGNGLLHYRFIQAGC